MSKWIAKKWHVAQQPDQEGNYVDIVARQKGMFAWLLEKMGIDASKRITIDDEKLVVEEASLRGNVRRVVPVDKISTTESGYTKPFYKAVGLSVAGLALFVVGAVIGVVYYLWNQQLTIGFSGSGGVDVSMNMKTKGLDGQELTEEHAARVTQVVEHLLVDSAGASPPELPADETATTARQQAVLPGERAPTA